MDINAVKTAKILLTLDNEMFPIKTGIFYRHKGETYKNSGRLIYTLKPVKNQSQEIEKVFRFR